MKTKISFPAARLSATRLSATAGLSATTGLASSAIHAAAIVGSGNHGREGHRCQFRTTAHSGIRHIATEVSTATHRCPGGEHIAVALGHLG